MCEEHTNEPLLTGWRNIAEVSAALDIPVRTIQRVVACAGHAGASWVRQEPEGRRRWLIDTGSSEYLRHEQRWRTHSFQERRAREAQLEVHSAKKRDETEHLLEEEEISLPDAGDPALAIWEDLTTQMTQADIAEIWPELCTWLSEQGLVIFSNGLVDRQEQAPWQWQWNHLAGSGYQSKRQAILAALDARLAPIPQPRKRWWHR